MEVARSTNRRKSPPRRTRVDRMAYRRRRKESLFGQVFDLAMKARV